MSECPICSFAVIASIPASNIIVQNVCLNSCGVNGCIIIGIFVGAFALNLIDKLVPHLHKVIDSDTEKHDNKNLDKVL